MTLATILLSTSLISCFIISPSQITIIEWHCGYGVMMRVIRIVVRSPVNNHNFVVAQLLVYMKMCKEYCLCRTHKSYMEVYSVMNDNAKLSLHSLSRYFHEVSNWERIFPANTLYCSLFPWTKLLMCPTIKSFLIIIDYK